MKSDVQTHILSDEELSLVTGGGKGHLNIDITASPQIAVATSVAVATSTVVILFSDVSSSSIGNSQASNWLSIKQSIYTS